MPSKPSIRELTADDALAYRDLRLRALKEVPSAFGSAYEDEVLYSEEKWRGHFHANAYTLGGFLGDELVGSVTLLLSPRLKMAHKAHLVAMYVAVEARGKGFGAALIERLQREAQNRNMTVINLNVSTHNHAALSLYKRHGFEIYGTEPACMIVDGKPVDNHLMRKELA